MRTAEECRVVARECERWAGSTKDGVRRAALLKMAAAWEDSACLVERHAVLAQEYRELTREAWTKLKATNAAAPS